MKRASIGTIFLLILGASSLEASINPQLAPSRTSGVAPLSVFFDASASTSTTTGRPFHDLDYAWSFGDPGSGNWSTTQLSKNTGKGPLIVHIFEKPGTYTVTLTVKNGSESATLQATITVSDPNVVFSGKTYYVSATGVDTNNGLSPSTSVKTFAKAMSYANSSARILFRRGDSFSASAGKTLSAAGPGIIGAYFNSDGSDDQSMAKPIISQSATTSVFYFTASGPDWRVMDLDLRGPATSSLEASISGGGTSPQTRSLVLRVKAIGFAAGFLTGWNSANHDENFIVDCTFSGIGSSAYSGGCGIYFGGMRSAILGTTIIGLAPTGQHIVRVWHGIKVVIAHNILMDPMSTKCSLKFHNEISVSPPPSEFILVSDNQFRGSAESVNFGPQNESVIELVREVIVERNIFRAMAESDRFLLFYGPNMTARNNIFIGNGSSIYEESVILVGTHGVSPSANNAAVYNNTFYKADNGSEAVMVLVESSVSNAVVRNNLAVVTPSYSGYQKQVIINNSGSTVASNNILRLNSADLVNPNGENFNLASTSTLRDAGFSLPVVLDDFGGSPRPQGSSWDVGAFEFQSGQPLDTTAPTVSITAPAAGTNVSGTVTITAGASDNVGVVAIQFKVNGVNIGSEDTASPYSISWDTTQIGDADYVLTAVARDAAGNSKTSNSITVTVTNHVVDTVPPAPPTGLRVQ